jgi:hypothetical protein
VLPNLPARLAGVTRQKFLMRILVLSGSAAFGGCVPEPTPLSTDPVVATRELHALVPKGTSVVRTRKILTAKGFTLSRMEPTASENHLLVATSHKQNHTWIAGIVIVDGRVVAMSVSVTKG